MSMLIRPKDIGMNGKSEECVFGVFWRLKTCCYTVLGYLKELNVPPDLLRAMSLMVLLLVKSCIEDGKEIQL
ncbi:hypothetical protein TNCT_641721 [Trichonephila clavata]|uniref:Uncharacterized protein n=1 Tax=Trichonephila clavata TaxID=2740835 RepID=A0A8X6KK41_TRICU|nr:hypothetical protein TNCT_641721 [Trichonephila clavata]